MGNPKSILDIMKVKNPRVFFNIDVDGVHAGRVVMELLADMSPKAVENFWVLCDGRPWCYYGDGSNIQNVSFFEAGPNFYISLSKTWGVVSAKILDGIDVIKALESVEVIYHSGSWTNGWKTTTEPVISVTCGQLCDQILEHHSLKNYGPMYHNMNKGSRIPHQYVYRSSGEGRDHKCRFSFDLSCSRYISSRLLCLLSEMPCAFSAFVFGC